VIFTVLVFNYLLLFLYPFFLVGLNIMLSILYGYLCKHLCILGFFIVKKFRESRKVTVSGHI